MDFGLALPNYRDGSTREGLEAAVDAAERLGFSIVWTTDHVLVEEASRAEYGRVFDAILTLAYLAARSSTVRLATSVIVVPQRAAVVVAKQLATLDVLSQGRLVAGVGVGWNRIEFENLGMGDRFRVRGAYLDEAIDLWRHLWSGATEPFEGRFHHLTDFVFEPLPVQAGGIPIVVGGRSEHALRRAGRKGDGYHFSSGAPAGVVRRLPVVRAAAEEVGRPMPWVSGRVRTVLGSKPTDGYAVAGTPDEMATELRAFAAGGVEHLAIALDERDPEQYVAALERFAAEVMPLVADS
jgi:probable F420-dependent oxidoreductase